MFELGFRAQIFAELFLELGIKFSGVAKLVGWVRAHLRLVTAFLH